MTFLVNNPTSTAMRYVQVPEISISPVKCLFKSGSVKVSVVFPALFDAPDIVLYSQFLWSKSVTVMIISSPATQSTSSFNVKDVAPISAVASNSVHVLSLSTPWISKVPYRINIPLCPYIGSYFAVY